MFKTVNIIFVMTNMDNLLVLLLQFAPASSGDVQA